MSHFTSPPIPVHESLSLCSSKNRMGAQNLVMGNCQSSSYNGARACMSRLEKPLDADPSIAGYGTLAAFTATTVLTFAAVILGYLTDSLPDHYLSDVDRALVERASSWRISKSLRSAWTAVRRLTRRNSSVKAPRRALTKKQRERALRMFVLTLSDQQLVTGIAILLASFSKWCETTVYELNMVVSLAFFSAITHLVTLDVLRDYFWHHETVRNWRMAGMVAIAILLIAGEMITGLQAGYNASAPLACLNQLSNYGIYDCNGALSVIQNATGDFDILVGPFPDDPYFSTCQWAVGNIFYDPDSDGIDSSVYVVVSAFISVYLAYSYTTALFGTFSIDKKHTLTPVHVIVHLHPYARHLPLSAVITVEAEKIAEQRANTDSWFGKRRQMMVWRTLRLLHLATVDYLHSFLFHIGSLSFAFSYGLAQVAFSRWRWDMPLQPGSDALDFGQIVALVLLALPLLAAAEIFSEDKDHDEEGVHRNGLAAYDEISATSTGRDEGHEPSTASIQSNRGHASPPQSLMRGTSRSELQLLRTVQAIFFAHVAVSLTIGTVLNLQGVDLLDTDTILAALLTGLITFSAIFRIFSILARFRSMSHDQHNGSLIENNRNTGSGLDLPATPMYHENTSQAAEQSPRVETRPVSRNDVSEALPYASSLDVGSLRHSSDHPTDTLQPPSVEDSTVDSSQAGGATFTQPNGHEAEKELRERR